MSITSKSRDGNARFRRYGARRACLSRFRDDESGGLIIFSLFIFVAMLLAAGLAIDFMRFETTRIRFQNTLDRAVLAAASLKQTQDPKDVVLDYFEKAGLEGYISRDDIDVDQTMAGTEVSSRRIAAAAGAKMKPIFLSFLGMEDMPIVTASSAEEGISNLEVSLVLDVSGSMGWASATGNTKIYELREAAKDFVYHMQCNPNADRSTNAECEVEKGLVSISIVPYSEQVAAGPQVLGEFNVTSEHEASFCVDFSEDDYLASSMGNFVKDPLSMIPPMPEDTLTRTGHFDPWRSRSSSAGDWTCKNDEWRWIKPLMADHIDAFAAIDALSAGGNTSIDVGMKWGTALVDPGIRPAVTSLTTKLRTGSTTETVIDPMFDDRPYDYGLSYMIKAVILMTDGVNTDQHYLKDAYRSGPSIVWGYRKPDGTSGTVYSVYNADLEKYRWVKANATDYDSNWHDDVYIGQTTTCEWVNNRVFRNGRWRDNWEQVCTTTSGDGTPFQMTYQEVWARFPTAWFNYFSWIGDAELAHGNATKNTRLEEICKAAKDQDILVYTIGFEVGEGSEAEEVMQNCATTVNHFFLADGSNLSDVFGAIATSLNQLKLTE